MSYLESLINDALFWLGFFCFLAFSLIIPLVTIFLVTSQKLKYDREIRGLVVFLVGFGLMLAIMSTWYSLNDDDVMTAREWVVMAWVSGAILTVFGCLLKVIEH